MPPFRSIKPVCHVRHKTVPEFISNLYDVDENHISTFTDVKQQFMCDLREVYISGLRISAVYTYFKFAHEFASRYR